MALFAILSDDKLSIREIRDFPQDTVFKSGYAFPVAVDPQPLYDPKTSYIEQSVALPNKGVVTVSWIVKDLAIDVKESIAKQDALSATFDQLQAIEEKIVGSGGKLEAADQTALLLYTLDALLSLREPLLQIQKRTL